MKKRIALIILIIFSFPLKLNASSGMLVQKSVKECSDGNLYGYHRENGEKHYHTAVLNEKENYIAGEKESLGSTNPCKDLTDEASIEKVQFVNCVDGDTVKLKVEGKEETIRLLAIDTPETKHPKKKEEPFGKEASNYTCDKLKNAKEIKLEFDPESEKRDKYDRLLAWVYVDNSLVQLELVENGLAKIEYIYGDYLYLDKLEIAEGIAKSSNKGIWGDNNESYISYIAIAIAATFSIIGIFMKKKRR